MQIPADKVIHRLYGTGANKFILCAPVLLKKESPATKNWSEVTCPACLRLKGKLSLK